MNLGETELDHYNQKQRKGHVSTLENFSGHKLPIHDTINAALLGQTLLQPMVLPAVWLLRPNLWEMCAVLCLIRTVNVKTDTLVSGWHTFEGGVEVVIVVMRGRGQVLSLQHGDQALVDADVLLLRLHHPHPLAPHRVHHAKDVQVFCVVRQLRNTKIHLTPPCYTHFKIDRLIKAISFIY